MIRKTMASQNTTLADSITHRSQSEACFACNMNYCRDHDIVANAGE